MMFKKWTGIERLIADLVPSLLPAQSGGGATVRQASDKPDQRDGEPSSHSSPTWLIPTYLRQQRSGDRVSRWS